MRLRETALLFFKRTGLILMGLVTVHIFLLVLYCIAEMIRSKQIYGVAIHISSSILLALVISAVKQFAMMFFPFSIVVSIIFGSISGKTRDIGDKMFKEEFSCGVCFYLIFSTLLAFSRPGFIQLIPIIRSNQFWIGYVLILLLNGSIVAFINNTISLKIKMVLISLALIITPHYSLRYLFYSMKSTARTTETKRVVISLDSARLDDTIACNPNRKVYSGISFFQSTRKQWMTMLGWDPKDLSNSLFIPTIVESGYKKNFKDFVNGDIEHRTKIAFLLDDGATVNRKSLNFDWRDIRINGEGLAWSVAATNLPIQLWLQNIISPVESVNCFSDIDAFIEDIFIANRSNDLVFAHTCFLERSISTWREFLEFRGLRYLLDRPNQYSNAGATYRGERGFAAHVISNFKIKEFIPKYESLFSKLDMRYPKFSGLLISDHGQVFDAANGKIGSAHHGFISSPDTFWIPIVIYGKTSTVATFDSGWYDWRDIRESILKSLYYDTPIVLNNNNNKSIYSSPFIVPPSPLCAEMGENILTVSEIGKFVSYNNKLGFYFSPKQPVSSYKKFYLINVPGIGIFTVNPENYNVYHIQKWDKYSLLWESKCNSVELIHFFDSLGFKQHDEYEVP